MKQLRKYLLPLVFGLILIAAAFYQNNIGPTNDELINALKTDQSVFKTYGPLTEVEMLNIIGSRRVMHYGFLNGGASWSGVSYLRINSSSKPRQIKATWVKDSNSKVRIVSVEDAVRK